MSTIIEYTDAQPPQNSYPTRIISPRRSATCCITGMEDISGALVEGRWVYRYRRCQECGFAVRLVVRALPDPEALASVHAAFAQTSFAGME